MGIDAFDYSGSSVAGAGDVNGDGFGDIIIGAPGADPDGMSYAGESYVVFGRASGFGASLDLATLTAPTASASTASMRAIYSGGSVASAGDVNGDGFGDLIIGARDPGGDLLPARATSCSAEPRGSAPASTSRPSTAPTAFASTGIEARLIAAAPLPGR